MSALSSRSRPSKQVLRLDVRRTELTGFVARKEDDAAGFLCISFKHRVSLPEGGSGFFLNVDLA